MSPISTSQPSSGFKVPKIVIDLFFTLAIPITLLASKLPFTDFNFSDTLGTRPTFVLAGIIPAAYILWDTWKTQKFNPVTALAAVSALTGGVLAFLQIDGWKFALKDSYGSIVVVLVMGVSLLLRQPFFGFILKVAATENREQEEAMRQLLLAPTVRKMLFWSTFIILIEALINGTLNFWINLQHVTENFGSKTFNNQVAEVNAMMRLPSLALTFIGYGLAFYAVRWAVETDFGPKVKLFEEGFFEALEESIADNDTKNPVKPHQSRGA
ncbi:MAG: VC0807 family protein [Deinococcaceae bacterium]